MKQQMLIVAVIALLTGWVGGAVTGALLTADNSVKNQQETAHGHGEPDGHMHDELYNVPADNAPAVELLVSEDAKSGWNIELKTENFTFAPENVNQDNRAGEGHAHLYVNGQKIGRLYGPYYHLEDTFEAGPLELRATLNANDHRQYAVQDVPVEDTVIVEHRHTE